MKSKKEILKKSITDKIRPLVESPFTIIVLISIIFKNLVGINWVQMLFIPFIIVLIIVLIIGLLVVKIKSKLSIKIRKSMENVFIRITKSLIYITILFMLVVIPPYQGILKSFTAELTSILFIAILICALLLFCYIIFDVIVTYFAEDAEYFFNEGCDALSKIEHEYKKPDDLLTFLFFYKKGFKKLNGKLGKQLSLSNIKFKAEDIGVLESIHKKLPYYLLYGKSEQFKRTKRHINTIQQSLGKSNELNGVSIIDEICKFLEDIDDHIDKKEVLPYKKSFLAEFIREHRDWIIPSIAPVIVVIASRFVHGT